MGTLLSRLGVDARRGNAHLDASILDPRLVAGLWRAGRAAHDAANLQQIVGRPLTDTPQTDH
ncbi:hypothetical protein [Spirillospora sp. NPDC048824]|uniref:hypothetical protein n=1 Tax=Spirillospora sp. NPDC048824 TaxID=3364526 RepID=UPI00372116D9